MVNHNLNIAVSSPSLKLQLLMVVTRCVDFFQILILCEDNDQRENEIYISTLFYLTFFKTIVCTTTSVSLNHI